MGLQRQAAKTVCYMKENANLRILTNVPASRDGIKPLGTPHDLVSGETTAKILNNPQEPNNKPVKGGHSPHILVGKGRKGRKVSSPCPYLSSFTVRAMASEWMLRRIPCVGMEPEGGERWKREWKEHERTWTGDERLSRGGKLNREGKRKLNEDEWKQWRTRYMKNKKWIGMKNW